MRVLVAMMAEVDGEQSVAVWEERGRVVAPERRRAKARRGTGLGGATRRLGSATIPLWEEEGKGDKQR